MIKFPFCGTLLLHLLEAYIVGDVLGKNQYDTSEINNHRTL